MSNTVGVGEEIQSRIHYKFAFKIKENYSSSLKKKSKGSALDQ